MANNWYHIVTGQFGYPQPENNFDYIFKTYDTSNACLTCKIGLEQKEEFRFRSAPKAKHSQFLGLNWVFDQIFVRQPVKGVFELEAVTGIEYSQPVINTTGAAIEGIYQLRVDNLISTGLLTDNLTAEICRPPKDRNPLRFFKPSKNHNSEGSFCGKTKYNFPKGDNRLRISSNAFEGATDFVRLDYYFGSGASANRPILVSEKVKQIIDREKWRGAFLLPVELV